ncbi:MAG: site-2 protease family protein [Bacteroidota bacterium]
MKGSFQIARIFDIPVKIHWTFLLLLLYLGIGNGYLEDNWIYGLWTTTIFLALFFCVLLHEFGHALTARRYGIITHDIILSPIGGVARLKNLPENPWEEFWVALAGPLVNFAIAFVLLPFTLWLYLPEISNLVGYLLQEESLKASLETTSFFRFFLPTILLLNIALGLFNLFPAYPMDGGRILRAGLAIRWGSVRATKIAARTGQVLAFVMFAFSFIREDLILAMIGAFVFVTASRELRRIKMEGFLRERTVTEIISEPKRMAKSLPLGEALPHFQEYEQPIWVLGEGGEFVGVLTANTVQEVLAEPEENRRQVLINQPIGSFLDTSHEMITNTTTLFELSRLLRDQEPSKVFLVVEQEQVVGFVSHTDLRSYMAQQSKFG